MNAIEESTKKATDRVKEILSEYGFEPFSDSVSDIHFSVPVQENMRRHHAHHASFDIEEFLDRNGVDRDMSLTARSGYLTYRWSIVDLSRPR